MSSFDRKIKARTKIIMIYMYRLNCGDVLNHYD